MKLKLLLELLQSTYSREFVEAVDAWMTYGQSFHSDKDIRHVNIDPKLRRISQPIYRIMSVPPSKFKDGKYGSWTTSLKFAKQFRTNSYFEGGDNTDAWLYVIKNPQNSRCILNIPVLFKDPEFVKTVEKYSKYLDGGVDFGDEQKEIIYRASLDEVDYVLEYDAETKKWTKHEF